MKKFLIGLLSCIMAGALSFGFAACDGGGNESDVGSANSVQSGEASNTGSSEISTDSSEISSGSSENEEDEVDSSAADSSEVEDSTSNDTSNSTSDSTSEEDSSVEEHTHVWDNGKVTTPPTCEGKGIKTYSCACGETYTEEIPATGHTYKTVVIAPTCEAKGYTSHVCDCGKALIDNYVDALGHNKTQHEAQAATCTEKGWEAYETCSRCDYTTYEEIPALGHGYVDHAAQAATCTEKGWNAYETCSRCDYTTYEEIPALGHGYVEHAAQAATCTEKGWEAYETCSRCDYTTYEEIPALGHGYVDHAAQAATCTAIGWEAYETCSRCDYTTYVEIPALGHDWDGSVCLNCGSKKTSEGLEYLLSYDKTSYSVEGIGACKDTNIVIPTTYEGLPVTSIGYRAFENCSSLTNITIPDSVTSIGNYAFEDCSSLTNITIPDSVTSIGYYAFWNCSSLTNITIPNSVTSIGQYAFGNCSSLVYTIQDGLKYLGNDTNAYYCLVDTETDDITNANINNLCKIIGGYAFGGCYSLESVEIGESVTHIGVQAFSGTDLTGVIIPNSVISLGDSAFSGCSKLVSVKLSESLTKIPNYAFNYCHSLGSVEIPASVTSIGINAFNSNGSLRSVKIPSSVTFIDSGAFADCEKLEKVYITDLEAWCKIVYRVLDMESIWNPDEVNPLCFGADLYLNNELLTNVTIPNTITKIQEYAFQGCGSITTVSIPDSVTSIGAEAFYGCDNLAKVEIPDSVTSVGESVFRYCNNLTYNVKDGLKYLGNENNPYLYLVGASTTNITTAIIDSGCRFIGTSAFSGGSSLTSVEIPDSVTGIGGAAFFGCSSLTSVEIPDSVTSIGVKAFSGCSSLARINIPKEITSISDRTFYGCTALAEIKYNATECADLSNYNLVFSYAGHSGEGIKVTIGANVKKIPAYLFCPNYSSNPPKIVSVEFEEGSICESIGEEAFKYCDNLANIYLPNIAFWCNIEGLPNLMVHGLSNKNLYLDGGLLTEVEIGDSVESIAPTAFFGFNGLTSVVISDSVTSIGVDAFSGCSSLTSVDIGDSVTSIGLRAFAGCSSLTNVVIPDSVVDIGDYAFTGCPIENADIPTFAIKYLPKESLQTVVITSGSSIDDSSFSGYTNLKSVTIGKSITNIGDCAFYGCTALTEIKYNATECADLSYYNAFDNAGQNGEGIKVTIGANVKKIPAYLFYSSSNYHRAKIISLEFEEGSICKSIGESAFAYCKELTSVVIPNSVTSIGADAFYSCSKITSIVIPESVTSMDMRAFAGCSIESAHIPTFLIKYLPKDSLQTIVITSGDKIDAAAFMYCSKLTSVVISNSVTSIEQAAFASCNSLTNVVISNSVTNIAKSAFNGCKTLTNITFNGTVEEWNAITKGYNWDYLVPATKVVCSDGEVVF